MDKPAIVAQPTTTVTQVPYGEKPNNYLIPSIINLLCCFFILGIIALIFSLQVDSAWSSGNYEGARSNANIAKILNIIGFVIGAVTWIMAVVIVIVSVVTSAAAASTAYRTTAGSFSG